MDEQEWLACTDPEKLLKLLGGQASARKLRLFAGACCRQAWSHFPEIPGHVVEVAERFGDGLAGIEELNSYQQLVHVALEGAERENAEGEDAARATLGISAPTVGEGGGWPSWEAMSLWAGGVAGRLASRERVMSQHATLLRCVFGSPFRPVALEPGWLTADVLSLAQAAYDNRILPAGTLEPERLGLLADALEDAGCRNTDLLGHLRGEGPHVRGCWPVDLLLGRE